MGWSWSDLMEMPERAYLAFLRIQTLANKKELREAEKQKNRGKHGLV